MFDSGRFARRGAAATTLAFALSLSAGAQERSRSEIPETFTWDLTDIYPTDDAWRAATDELTAELPGLERLAGTLDESAAHLADALDELYRLSRALSRTFVYASLKSDQDTRVGQYQGMQQEMLQIASRFAAEAAFFEPEILEIGQETVDRFVAAEPRLRVHAFYLDDILRRRDHTGSDAEERLLAAAGIMSSAPSSIFSIFANADFPYPEVTLSGGDTVRIDAAGFSRYRAVANRNDREAVMAAFFGALGDFRGTWGALLNAQVQSDVFYARARDYDSALVASLNGPNIPVTVYSRLVDGVNRHLPTFHRYLNLRKRMLGVDELHYYDLYAPLVASVDLAYTVDEARAEILAALEPLGDEYRAALLRAFDDAGSTCTPRRASGRAPTRTAAPTTCIRTCS